MVTDFDSSASIATLHELPFDPSLWERFRERNHVEFPLDEDQFFVMGDNSPESSDAGCGSAAIRGRRPAGRRVSRTADC